MPRKPAPVDAVDIGFHPAAEFLRRMNEAEFEDLVARIKARGQRVPIVRYGGLILDGRHRYMACRRLRIEPRFEDYEGDESPLDVALDLNVGRRHLTADEKRSALAFVLKDNPKLTDRQAAAKLKVDHKTAGAVRRELQAAGEVPITETRTDTKGREQPTSKAPATKPEPPAEPVDAAGVAIPAALRDVFGDPLLRDGATLLHDLEAKLSLTRFKIALRGKGQHYPFVKGSEVLNALEDARSAMQTALALVEGGRPTNVCPKCKGKKCGECRKSGLVPAWRFKELKGAVA
jgi:hypothetical protein